VKLPSLSRTQAMEALSLGRHPLANLLASGCLPDLRVDRVAALASRARAASDCPLVIVRAGQHSWDGTRKIGYHTSYLDEEVLDGSRQWWISNTEEIKSAAHILLTVSTWAVALLHVTGCAGTETVTTTRGNTVKRHSYEATLAARVDNLVEGEVRNVSPVPDELAPLLSVLGQRLPSPPGAPLIVTRP
jgi:hypothetical protein